MNIESSRRQADRGYSLIEVLIAIAILGSVIVGILSLFVMGRRNVYSGKQMTEAISTGTRALEDLNTMTKTSTLTAFNLATATTGTDFSYGGQSFTNSFLRTTSNISSTTDPSGFLTRWRDEMVNNKKFDNGEIAIVFTPRNDSAGNNPVRMTTATVVRLRIFVTWREARRNRQVVVDTVKIER
jgi:prepilin-type N-terminal cleavage/methylation domain-containing protein